MKPDLPVTALREIKFKTHLVSSYLSFTKINTHWLSLAISYVRHMGPGLFTLQG